MNYELRKTKKFQTNPIFKMLKMNITRYKIRNCGRNRPNRRCKIEPNLARHAIWRANPILPIMAGKIALPIRHSFSDGGSEAEGPIKN
jgi:hypothetical protein